MIFVEKGKQYLENKIDTEKMVYYSLYGSRDLRSALKIKEQYYARTIEFLIVKKDLYSSNEKYKHAYSTKTLEEDVKEDTEIVYFDIIDDFDVIKKYCGILPFQEFVIYNHYILKKLERDAFLEDETFQHLKIKKYSKEIDAVFLPFTFSNVNKTIQENKLLNIQGYSKEFKKVFILDIKYSMIHFFSREDMIIIYNENNYKNSFKFHNYKELEQLINKNLQ